jgi:hypothetical protein
MAPIVSRLVSISGTDSFFELAAIGTRSHALGVYQVESSKINSVSRRS